MLTRRQDETDANCVSVDLLGDEYVIRGTDSTEHLAQVAAVVETRLREDQEANPRLAKLQLAILVALRLADDLAKLQQEHEEIQRLLAEAK